MIPFLRPVAMSPRSAIVLLRSGCWSALRTGRLALGVRSIFGVEVGGVHSRSLRLLGVGLASGVTRPVVRTSGVEGDGGARPLLEAFGVRGNRSGVLPFRFA